MTLGTFGYSLERKNFTHMPELSWTFGYPFSLLLMAAVVAGLWIFFRKSGWF